ncbi:hypothetical protein PXD56_02685 [Maribacter sp. SA7]|uniref:hypothetical protein n=1 Tax=Maribacter zhoushanensis TaxID=3030012 RepID=UPI0023EB4F95|nr:hypothetical protein [Maribacter zhoushanensis]MDF4201844.1 hypothetical protein [Maribacter zhoushanensis]
MPRFDFNFNKYPQLFIFFITISISSCNNSDDIDEIIPTGKTKEYTLLETNISDLTGTIIFSENTNGSTTVLIQVNNTVKDIDLPVYLRRNTANTGGGIAIILNNIIGENGNSNTVVSKLNNGETISYSELLEFNGYIAIEDNVMTGSLLAYSDLGPNELTGNKKIYNLFAPNGAINGLITLEERKKGTTSLTIGILQTNENDEFPVTLNILSESNTLENSKQLNPITGSLNGFSFNELTDINEEVITFDKFIQTNSFIEIKQSIDTENFVASGGIGNHAEASPVLD